MVQHDEINMQQLYEINMQNTQNATSRTTVSLPHDIDAQFINYFVTSPTVRRNVNAPNLAEQSHVSSSSNIISASNANALHVGNTSQYASNSMRVHHSTFVPVWYVFPKVLLVDDDL
ncbi:11970_t:CDS:2, partial [Racocetra persica]